MAQWGKEFVLQIETAVPGTYVTVAGLRNTTLTMSASEIDITNKDNVPNTTLLDAAGVKSIEASGDGVFENDTTWALVNTAFVDQTITPFKLLFWDGTADVEVDAKILSLELSGTFDDAQAFTISIKGSGAPVITL